MAKLDQKRRSLKDNLGYIREIWEIYRTKTSHLGIWKIWGNIWLNFLFVGNLCEKIWDAPPICQDAVNSRMTLHL